MKTCKGSEVGQRMGLFLRTETALTMSASDPRNAAKSFQMPEEFSFGLEERAKPAESIHVSVNDGSGCAHKWFERPAIHQTLRHEGKTVLECHACRLTTVVHDWKIKR